MDAVWTPDTAPALVPACKSSTKYWPHPEIALVHVAYESTGCQSRAVPGRIIHPIRSLHLLQELHATTTLPEAK